DSSIIFVVVRSQNDERALAAYRRQAVERSRQHRRAIEIGVLLRNAGTKTLTRARGSHDDENSCTVERRSALRRIQHAASRDTTSGSSAARMRGGIETGRCETRS